MLNKLEAVVREVGELLLEWRKEGLLEGEWKEGQFKARVDLMAHNMLVVRLEHVNAAIPVISEEDPLSLHEVRPPEYWLIDPIDGTASFVNGFSGFVTQIAHIQNGRVVASAICAPALGALYLAEKGAGAFLNGKRLQVKANDEGNVLIDNYPEPRGITAQLFKELAYDRYVECGSISLKICKVADGTADTFFKDVVVRDWDIGAPQLILQEAGGVITDKFAREFSYEGSFEKPGIIGAASAPIHHKVAAWYKEK